MDSLLLKWGTLKGWNIQSDAAKAAAKKYGESGPQSPSGVMTQHDTAAQKQALCELIDAIDSDDIRNDWSGEAMTKEEAKEYVLGYK